MGAPDWLKLDDEDLSLVAEACAEYNAWKQYGGDVDIFDVEMLCT